MQIRNVLRNKKGEATVLMVALILGLLLVVCAMAEFFRLLVIVQGVRDGLQQSVITVATANYDETYNGLREGYSGGYILSGDEWQENLDYDYVLIRLGNLLGADRNGSALIKRQSEGYEYRLSGLDVEIINTPHAPSLLCIEMICFAHFVSLCMTASFPKIFSDIYAPADTKLIRERKLTGAIITRPYRSTTARSLFQNLISLSDVPFTTRAKLKTKHHGIPNNYILRNLRNRYNLAMCI